MKTGLKPYASHSESGTPWLGRVPDHWRVLRLKRVCSGGALYGANVAGSSYTTSGVRFVRTTDITGDGQLKDGGVFVPEELVREYLLDDGDVLVSRSGTIGRSFLYRRNSHGPCAYAGYLVRFVPTQVVLPKYIFLFTKTQAFTEFLRVMAITSTIENVNGEKYANCVLPVPPLSEQSAIVRFLAHAGRHIQRYISAKQKLITLLDEHEQATIDQAMTGQIDPRTGKPHAAYKQVQVAGLQKVPEHWRLVRLKETAEVQTGLTLGKDYRNSTTVTRPYLRVANVQHGHLDLTEIKHIDVPPNEARRSTLSSGDVLMTEGGDIDKLGRGCLWENEVPGCLHQNHVFAVRCDREQLVPEFLVGLMRSRHGRAYFQLTAKQTTNLASTNSTTLRVFPIPLPPVDEQLEILDKVSEEIRTIHAATSRTVREIELVREYRTCLIANIVTGKLDVREAAASLPEVEHLKDEINVDVTTSELIGAESKKLDKRVEVA